MKMIKQRAVTINKKRAVEMALTDQNGDGSSEGNEGGLMQGLYAKGQTELYIPPPVVDVSFSSPHPAIRICPGHGSLGHIGH